MLVIVIVSPQHSFRPCLLVYFNDIALHLFLFDFFIHILSWNVFPPRSRPSECKREIVGVSETELVVKPDDSLILEFLNRDFFLFFHFSIRCHLLHFPTMWFGRKISCEFAWLSAQNEVIQLHRKRQDEMERTERGVSAKYMQCTKSRWSCATAVSYDFSFWGDFDYLTGFAFARDKQNTRQLRGMQFKAGVYKENANELWKIFGYFWFSFAMQETKTWNYKKIFLICIYILHIICKFIGE